MARRDKREGRGRLSSIDLLPAEADEHIQWASEELLKRDLTQTEILDDFNERLKSIGCEPISKSAFNRFSMAKAATTRALAETREVSKVVAETLGAERADHITIMLVELLKNAAYQLSVAGNLKSKDVLDLSRALQALIGAQRKSGELRREDEDERKKKFDKAAEAAVDGIAAKNPEVDKAEVLRQIREEIYGIFE